MNKQQMSKFSVINISYFQMRFKCNVGDVIRSSISCHNAPFTILFCSLLYSYTSSLFFLACSILAVLQYLYLLQDSLLYQPGHPPHARNHHPLPKSTHEIVNFGQRSALNGILFKYESGNCPTIIFFHGNAGNASNRTQMIEFMRTILKMNVFVFDYSGYGLSRNRPSEAQLYQDGQVSTSCYVQKTSFLLIG